ncbi:MAG TPA: hypothetical protein VM261_08055 [Kofleriaceae bacterium]|nr:hypothetical protein [Kofleriaceae bacterium]
MQARFVMAPPPSDEAQSRVEQERAATRHELERLRIELALSQARVSEACQQRDRAQAALEKVTGCLVECQGQLQVAGEREEQQLKELNELRVLVDAHQEETQAVTEASVQVQALCDELRAENDRLRAELAERDAAPEPKPERQVARPMALVNVAR